VTSALVTGGSGGIGGAVCAALAEAGHHVLVGYRSGREAAEKVAADIGGEAVELDVTDGDSVAAAIEVAHAAGGLHTVVNNAGVSSDALLLRLEPEDWDRTLRVNLTGAYLVSRAALRPMLRARAGRIVNVASIVGLRGNAGQTAYAASKAGLIGFTRSLAREVAHKGITANVVAPGYVATAMTEQLSQDQRQALSDLAPTRRAVAASEVAAAIAFLASEAAASITGAVLPVDGGAAM
jgi:3-oxoacyl-[acyl-carrier protein] reductase